MKSASLLVNVRASSVVLCCVLLLGACQPRTPDDLALTVLLEEIGQLDGVVMGFIPCVSIDSVDADWSALATLRKRYPEVVPASECPYEMTGTFHKTSRRKAMLVNVFGYKRSGEIELEARHAGRFATSKTLQVKRAASGWKIVATLRFEMASTGSPGLHLDQAHEIGERHVVLEEVGRDQIEHITCRV